MGTLIKQWEDLALALGAVQPAHVAADKKAMCEAAARFTAASKIAHDKGVRVMAMYPKTNLFYLANPTGNSVLRMLEELGAPLLHPGGICDEAVEPACSHSYFWENVPRSQYFVGCDPDVDETEKCVGKTLYPVDLALYDQRLTIKIQNTTENRIINEPAIVKGQIAYWPGAGLPHTYEHAAEILTILAPALEKAERIHPKTECTPDVNVTSLEHAKTPMLEGKYACFDSTYHNDAYTICPSDKERLSSSSFSISGSVGTLVLLGTVVVVSLF